MSSSGLQQTSLCQSPSQGPDWEHITPPGSLLLRTVRSKESPGVKMLQNLRPATPEGSEEGAALQDGALAYTWFQAIVKFTQTHRGAPTWSEKGCHSSSRPHLCCHWGKWGLEGSSWETGALEERSPFPLRDPSFLCLTEAAAVLVKTCTCCQGSQPEGLRVGVAGRLHHAQGRGWEPSALSSRDSQLQEILGGPHPTLSCLLMPESPPKGDLHPSIASPW